ncbi:hypothetical protein [Arenimonas sp. MALMAid1274]|uniref:hypothetical protein n=1 Tax=Arenimonas sp. MALMAid1274 TaxID=3411630 RepID=UPI003BA08382
MLLVLLVLACVSAGLLPRVARATEPLECSQGCHIIVCNNDVCSIWRCDSQGCRYLANWRREDATKRQGLAAAPASPPERVYAQVCAAGRDCELYEVGAHQALRVARYANVGDLVRERQRQFSSPARTR